ncbi:MAG TPA: TolC family protein [Candidatus Binataceae bacterium]|nr:TolC family protein [Candidatus Binataceae bacterium]
MKNANRLPRVPRAISDYWYGAFRAAALAVVLISGGCANLAEQPAIYPDRFAPPSSDREWAAAPAIVARHTAAASDLIGPQSISPGAQAYDLDAMVELALRNNPRTRRAWEAALAAAAEFGASQAPYYPMANVQADNGYMRVPFQLPGTLGVIKQWQSVPVANVTYVLLDFGRRRSAAEAAHERLIASNFAFNRAIQQVVFDTQSAFYALDGALAAVTAAQQNLALAQTDSEAVLQRENLGLATEPELLLAKERVAQSQFDLANARLLVHDAQANLAVALGVPANLALPIESLESLAVPKSLGGAVDALIDEARRQRPDLAAQMAAVRASEAQVSEARAQFLPTIGLSGSYGEDLWNYTFVVPRTIQTGQPQYSAMLTLQWDLFTGFRRHNDVREAEADREAAQADLRSAELDTVAEVWRAYYEFESSLSKYAYAQSLMDAARAAYEANSETYRQGLSTIVELLTAERDLANARYTLVRTKAEVLTASAAVAYAAGAVPIR